MELQSDLSKYYLAEALILLMKKKDYSSITNKEITDKAGLSHITIYRNFKNKDEIIQYYLDQLFKDLKNKWNIEKNIFYNIFTFFKDNETIFDLICRNNLQYILLNNLLLYIDYKEDDSNIAVYSKVSVVYLIFGWCMEWYKRGMKETPEEMAELFEQNNN